MRLPIPPLGQVLAHNTLRQFVPSGNWPRATIQLSFRVDDSVGIGFFVQPEISLRKDVLSRQRLITALARLVNSKDSSHHYLG